MIEVVNRFNIIKKFSVHKTMVLFFKSMSNYEISAHALFASFMLTAQTKIIEKELELTSNSFSISAILASPFETRVLAPDIQLIQLKLFSEGQLKPWTSRPETHNECVYYYEMVYA